MAATAKLGPMYRLGAYQVDPDGRELRCDGQVVHLEPQAFDLLVFLIRHRDRVVPKAELLDGVWGHGFLSESNLTTRIKEVRRAVGDDGRSQNIVRNFRGRGYRFIATLTDDMAVEDTGIDDTRVDATPAEPASIESPMTTLIGRDDELRQIAEALRSTPIVTLVGPGGVGKTALARAVLADARRRGPGPGHFVDLSPLEPGADVLAAVAQRLQVSLDRSRPESALSALAQLDDLVVLDNCEHVFDGAAALVAGLTAEPDRRVRLLATSRIRIGVTTEWVHHLAPLGRAEAIELFQQRANAARGAPDVAIGDQARVESMLAHLDRLPLAIEMAAARLGSMTVADLADALAASAPVLQMSHRASGHRHRSLRSLVAWSVELLSAPDRELLEDCSVFAGDFTAGDVAGAFDTGPTAAARLADLADQSLLAVDLGATTTHYRMLYTVRSEVRAAFDRSARADLVRARHAHHAAKAAAAADLELRGPDEPLGRGRMASTISELRSAHHWARTEDAQLADDICRSLHLYTYSSFWSEPERWALDLLEISPTEATPCAYLLVAGAAANRGALEDAESHARRALASPDALTRGIAWEIIADVAIYSGDYDATRAAADALEEIADALGDHHFRAIAVTDCALAEAYLGDPRQGLALVERIDPNHCAPSDRGWLLYTRGELLSALGDEGALAAFTAALDQAALGGNPFVESVAQLSLAVELDRMGQRDASRDAYATCLQGYLRHGNLTHAVTALRNLVEPLAALGETETAVAVASITAGAVRHSYGAEAERVPVVAEQIRLSLGERFEELWASAAELTIEAALRLAADALARHGHNPDGGTPVPDPQPVLTRTSSTNASGAVSYST